jgi:hypothetical protein
MDEQTLAAMKRMTVRLNAMQKIGSMQRLAEAAFRASAQIGSFRNDWLNAMNRSQRHS